MPFIQHTVLFKFPSIEGTVPAGLAEIVQKFGTLPGIVADFFPHGAGIGGAESKASFLQAVAWPDKTEGYTHCLLIVASDEASLKAYLHGDYHQKLWFPAVGPLLKGIIVFDNVLEPDIIKRLEAKLLAAADGGEPTGLCATETPPPPPPLQPPTSASAAAAAAASSSAPVSPGGGEVDYAALSDAQVAVAVERGVIKDHQLETKLKDCARAVVVRRTLFDRKLGSSSSSNGSTISSSSSSSSSSSDSSSGGGKLAGLPHAGYAYDQVFGANCEVVVGYVPLPCGLVGPLLLDGTPCFVPMATTEGCLVASTNRGAKAISQSPTGARATIVKDGITRAPCLVLPTAGAAAALKGWCDDGANWEALRGAFESTTSFGKLRSAVATVAGRNLFLRLTCFAGDAMGMNMVSKGTLAVVALLQERFPAARLVSISGNVCSDKKPAAINWIEGRGKSVVVEAVIPGDVVEKTLKTTVAGVVDVAYRKNLVGSAMAGAVGGFNAHAANIVAAVFLACGQDPAQVVESANCITLCEAVPATGPAGLGALDAAGAVTPSDAAAAAAEAVAAGGVSQMAAITAAMAMDLHISVTMPSIEVGTVGGGTSLPAQAACLDVMGCRGAARGEGQAPGDHARQLGKLVAAATLAGELSLLAALAANDLVKSHMQHNRKKA